MDDPAARYRMNQAVKAVLVRHSVDLGGLSFTCTSGAVYLYGGLAKTSGGQFSAVEIENCLKEMAGLPGVRYINCDIADWVIAAHDGAWVVSRLKGGGAQTQHSLVLEIEPPKEDPA